MRTIYNLMLTALLLSLAATAARAQFEFAAKQPLQVQGTMAAPTLSSEIALAGPDGSTYLLGAFDTEFEFAGKALRPGVGSTNSFLLKFNPDGTEAWGMYITSNTAYEDAFQDVIKGSVKVHTASMIGENILVAVRVKGEGGMVAADGVTVQPIGSDKEDYRVLMLLVSPDADLLGMKELVVEDIDLTGFMPLDPMLEINQMGVLSNGQLCVAGNLKGKLSVDGVEIMSSNLYDPFGMGWKTTTHSIAFCARYDMATQSFARVDTIRPRDAGGSVQLLSAAIDGDDVYLAFNVQRKVGCNDKEWDVSFVDGEYNQNGMLLAKFNASGIVWDKLTEVEALGTIMHQPYAKPFAMSVVGEKLLMGGLFSVKADFGNGVVINTLSSVADAAITDYFFAIGNTADGQMLVAFVFGCEGAEVSIPNGVEAGAQTFREHIKLATDGVSAFLMGSYMGTISTPAGNKSSIDGTIDNFLLRYNLTDKKWDGMSFGGPANDYAASLCLVDDTMLVAGSYAGAINNNSITSLSSSATGYNAYCVRFFDEWFTMTIGSTANGTLLTSPTGGAVEGRTVTITNTPASGYRLKEGSLKVYETGNPTNVVVLSGNSFAMPRFAVTVEGEFEEVPIRSLNVSASPAEGGTISGQSTGNFDDGTAVTLTATPASGYRFVKWVEGATDISTDNPYTFSITADRSLVAVFEKITGLLDARIEPLTLFPNPTTGAVQVEAFGEVSVFSAGRQLLQRVPSQGKVLIDLSGYPTGIYIIRVGSAAAKVVKM